MKDRRKSRHTRVWRIWRGMRDRCNNPKNRAYPAYGGRGITVCERWQSLANFKADMGDPPAGLTLDRIDNDKGYSPENCRWATPLEQSRNRRSVRILTLNGETLPLPTWADRAGLTVRQLRQRLDAGWDLARALARPTDRRVFKFTAEQEDEIRRRLANREKGVALAREYGISRSTLWHIQNRTIEHFDAAEGPGERQQRSPVAA